VTYPSERYFKDDASLSATLKNLLDLAANGRAAQQVILELYTWDKIVSAYL
jgi:hypothetical protein